MLAADRERAALLAAAELATDGLKIAEIQTRLADIGAHSAPARAAEILAGLGFAHRGSRRCAASRILRRLANAARACRNPVCRAGSPAPGRADQLSRPRRHSVAQGASRPLSAHGPHHQPRPRPARPCGELDPASGGRQALALPRRLLGVRAAAERASAARPQARQAAGGPAQAPHRLRRALSRQSDKGAPGAIAASSSWPSSSRPRQG